MNPNKILFILSLMTIMSACQKDDNSPTGGGGGQVPDATFSYELNGETYTHEIKGYAFVDESLFITNKALEDTSNPSSDFEGIELGLTTFLGPADYDLGPGFMNIGIYSSPSNEYFFSNSEGGSGLLSISALDPVDSLLSGSFVFSAPSFTQPGVSVTIAGTFENLGKLEE